MAGYQKVHSFHSWNIARGLPRRTGIEDTEQKGAKMSVEKVRDFLKQYGKDGGVMEFDVSSATVELAAIAVGVIPARIAKSLTFYKGEKVILLVRAGDAKVDNAKFKAEFGLKARMLTPQDAADYTGYQVGGVCPFAIENPAVEIYTDISMKRFATVFPSCGSSNSAVELTCEEIGTLSGSLKWVDVCKGWQ